MCYYIHMEQSASNPNLPTSPENQRFAELLQRTLDYSLERAAATQGRINWENEPQCKLIFDENAQIIDASLRTQHVIAYEDPEGGMWGQHSQMRNVRLSRTQQSIATGETASSTVTVPVHSRARWSFLAKSKTSHPVEIIQLFADGVANAEQAKSLLDVVLAEPTQKYLEQTRANTPLTIGTALGKLFVRSTEEADIEALQLTLLQEAFSDDPARAEQAQKIVKHAANSIIMGRLNKGDITFQKATTLLEPFIMSDLLGDKIADIMLFFHSVESPANEVLMEWLVTHPRELSQAEHQSQILFAKKHIQKVLTRYSEDPERHQGNIAIIREQLFPDAKRTDSLSRDRLVGLSNGISKSQNAQLPADEQLPLLDKNKNASVGEAFRRLLSITSKSTIDQATFDAQRYEDTVTANIVSLLFEPQSVTAIAEKLPEQVRVIGNQAIRAFIRSRQKSDRSISGHRLHAPGYGHLS
jgi:hypothetical protein